MVRFLYLETEAVVKGVTKIIEACGNFVLRGRLSEGLGRKDSVAGEIVKI